MLYHGDCLEQLKLIESESVDSLITDPPAGISFMGKGWDSDKGGRDSWIAWMAEVMSECHRVLKPGAHGLVWALPRTSHWTATACENAGFEVRDCISHLFGSGFPKSLNLEKATNGIAKGQGTALKPAHEMWWMIRKPCSEKTVAANVLKHGTGGINIDVSRIHGSTPVQKSASKGVPFGCNYEAGTGREYGTQGRFPANLVFSHSPYCSEEMCDIECAIAMLDAQSGTSKSTPGRKRKGENGSWKNSNKGENFSGIADSGGASRFFYCAKISSSERNAGLDRFANRPAIKFDGGDFHGASTNAKERTAKNIHPTVKPKKLMTYLIKLITPPNGVVLDPFMGSGSTGLACKESGFGFVGIEKEKEYFEIAKARIDNAR